MNLAKLYRVLVVAGASSTTGIVACGGEGDEGDEKTTGPANTAGATNTGGSTSGGSGNSTGGTSPGGRPSTGGGASDCASQCETLSNGWVMCNGSCCWLGATDPCCRS